MPRTGSVFTLAPSTVAPAVPGTPASAADFNAAMADISQALTDSMVTDAPAFTSPAAFDGGTADAPGITFAGDLDTGIWHPAANQVGITVDGAVTGTVLLAKTAGVDVTGALTVDGAVAATGAVSGTTGSFTGKVTAEGFDAGTNTIDNVVDPTTDQQAATKKYVDDTVGGGLSAEVQPTAGTNTSTTGLRMRVLMGALIVLRGNVTATNATAAHEVLATIVGWKPGASYTAWGTGVDNLGVEFNDYFSFTPSGADCTISCARGLTAADKIFLDGFVFLKV